MANTLLLADDSVTIQRVIELTFAHEDVRVVSVSDGRRAMQWLDESVPDIVLADVDLPETDGYTLAAHIKQTARLQGVPVLLLAGAFEPVDQARIASIGCDGVLMKPFEPQQLVGRVREALEQGVLVAHGGAKADPDAEGGKVTPFRASAGARTMDTGAAGRAANPDTSGEAETLELPDRPAWGLGLSDSKAAPAPAPAELPPAAPEAASQKVSLVSAFSALLAAEESATPGPSASANTSVADATVEDAVRRVLVRMTDDLVRRIVVETAERLIREEIEKIKSNSE